MWQQKMFAEMAPSFWSLLFAFALSLGLAAVHLLEFSLRTRPWAARLDRLCAFATFLLACLVSVDVIHRSYVWVEGLPQILFAAGVFTVAASTPYLHWWAANLQSVSRSVRGRVVRGTLGASCAAAACWSGLCFYESVRPVDDMGLFRNTPGQMAEVDRFVALTDAGHPVPLYRWDVAEAVFKKYAALSAMRLAGLAPAVIQRAPADPHANCHGWVFTEGKFLLRGREVEQILQDNGYAVTSNPRAEDLVIYRNDAGEIVHTGIVRGLLDDGTVMIESKFGIDGRYLHQPADQPYSDTFAYYRTSRPIHSISIRSSHRAGESAAPDDASRLVTGHQLSDRSAGTTRLRSARS